MAVLVIFGHAVDYFNMVMPGTVGPYWNNLPMALLVTGSFIFVVGAFILVVMTTLSKMKLMPTGNPFYHESEIYEYPF